MVVGWVRQLGMLVVVAIAGASGGCAADASASSDDGAESLGATQQAITNGTNDDKDPAIVALMLDGKVFCTGALVTPSLVVTAGHCVSPTPPTQIYFGSTPTSKTGGTLIDVADSKVHPDFDEDTLENDIALVALATKAPTTPLPVFTKDFDSSFTGLPIRIVGFGATSGVEQANLRKRSGTTKIESYSDDDFRFHPGPSQTCNGDSGGPALAKVGDKEILVGITSSGDSDCKTYGRDMRIDRYTPFISGYAQKYSAAAGSADDGTSKGCSMTARRSAPGTSNAGIALAIACAGIGLARSMRRKRTRD